MSHFGMITDNKIIEKLSLVERHRKTIERLMRWKETWTIEKNAQELGISKENAFLFSSHYNMQFKRLRALRKDKGFTHEAYKS